MPLPWPAVSPRSSTVLLFNHLHITETWTAHNVSNLACSIPSFFHCSSFQPPAYNRDLNCLQYLSPGMQHPLMFFYVLQPSVHLIRPEVNCLRYLQPGMRHPLILPQFFFSKPTVGLLWLWYTSRGMRQSPHISTVLLFNYRYATEAWTAYDTSCLACSSPLILPTVALFNHLDVTQIWTAF